MTLAELCALVDGRVPLVIELKSAFRRRPQAGMAGGGGARRAYSGATAVGMSFDPDQVIGATRDDAGACRAVSSPWRNTIIPANRLAGGLAHAAPRA